MIKIAKALGLLPGVWKIAYITYASTSATQKMGQKTRFSVQAIEFATL